MVGIPGIVISAPRSGGGKTTLALGIMRALTRRGFTIAPVKCGPDYIDPAFHAAAAGRPGVNLDSWAMPPAQLLHILERSTRDADLVVVEGAMGLFDGIRAPPGRSGSAADVACALGFPVVLVLDVKGQSQSAAALALGMAMFDTRLSIAGVVLNRVASERHRDLLMSGFANLDIPVIGALPARAELSLPERHLGLVQASETASLDCMLESLAAVVAQHVDLDRIVEFARGSKQGANPDVCRIAPPGQRIAVASDVCFSFIYSHVIDAWRDSGAEIRFFSPLADESPALDCDVCWLPGGYPELHAGVLASAQRFRASVQAFSRTRPVHGECGGYMVLGNAIVDPEGTSHPMLGLLDVVTSFNQPRRVLGYREAALLQDGVLGPRGSRWRGHEFHYAVERCRGSDEPFLQLTDPSQGATTFAGHRRGLVSGSFFHMIAPVD